MDRYERICKLGEGGFGQVFLVKDIEKESLPNQGLFAIKLINRSEFL
jgi:serine/threonine protein kinase